MIDSGASVATWDVMPPQENRLGAPPAKYCVVDVTDEHSIALATEEVISELGDFEILVNCAGIGGPHIGVTDCALETWQRVLDVNLTGTFLCARAAVRHMSKRGTGRIVNVASAAGKDGNPFSAPYACSRAAVIAFTKSLAKEVATTAIRVNCVTPGAVDTELFRRLDASRRAAAIAKIRWGA